MLPGTRPARVAILGSSFTRRPGPVSKKKLAEEVDRILSGTIRDFVKRGGVIHLPVFFKRVLRARIVEMILEERKKNQ